MSRLFFQGRLTPRVSPPQRCRQAEVMGLAKFAEERAARTWLANLLLVQVATPNSVQIVPQVLGWMEMSVAGAGPVDVGERWSLMA